MSFQNSVNQLIGSASYYASINPGLREAQAERKTTERIQRNAAKAQEAVQEVQYKQRSEQRNLRENADNLYDFVSDLGGAANQYNMAARLHNVGEQAHNMQVSAAEAAFAPGMAKGFSTRTVTFFIREYFSKINLPVLNVRVSSN